MQTGFYLTFNKNGTFSIQSQSIQLMNCYPGINHKALQPVAVHLMDESKDKWIMEYTLANEGKIKLVITHDDQEVTIKSELRGLGGEIHWFHPIFEGEVQGIAGIFRQGFGMAGPSGPVPEEQWKDEIHSFGLTALMAENESLIVYTDQHDRFINQYSIKKAQYGEQTKIFSAGFRVENIYQDCIALPLIRLTATTALEEGLTDTAVTISHNMNVGDLKKPAYHWCSWYYNYQHFSHNHLRSYLTGFKKLIPQLNLQYIQIDAGYFPSAGDWLETNERWPNGLASAFQDIEEAGFRPGIWIGPYMVGNQSRLYSEHPDWVLKDLSGVPVKEWTFYNEERVWGYPDEEYYVLDTSHPEAMEYIRQVFRIFRSNGVELFKTDFMLWGIQDSTKVIRHNPGKTSFEYFRELLQVIREEIGEESYWLGCIAPFMPFVGYADGMRIAGDVGAEWKEGTFGPINMIQETKGCNYMNQIWWQNDPDAMMIRNFHNSLTEVEIESLVLLQAVSGGAVYTSDPLHKIDKSRLELFRFVEPRERYRAKQPYLGQNRKEIVMMHEWQEEERYLLFLFNPNDYEIVEHYSFLGLTPHKELYWRLWRTGDFTVSRKQDLLVRIPPHGSQLYFLSAKEKLDYEIINLWDWKTL